MKTCTNCGMNKEESEFGKNKTRPDGLQDWCKQCRAEHYSKNREAVLERMGRNYRSHREEKLIYAAEYAEKNKDIISNKRKSYYLAHVEQYAEREARRYAVNRQKRIENVIRWRKANPDKLRANARAWTHRRRARLAQTFGSYSPAEFEELCAKNDNACLCCGQKKPLTADHVIPISRGGSNDIGNIQPLCLSCNCKKNDKTIDYRKGMGNG